MKILITGGAGYLGTVLLRQLLRDPIAHDLVILDRFDHGPQPLLSILGPVDSGRVTLLQGDVANPAKVAVAMHGCDTVIHLAGIVGYPACDADPQDADRTNVQGTQEVVTAALRASARVIFASTGSCYGKVDGEATEDSPLSPLTRYGRNKAEGENLVLAADGTVLRLATLFGLSPRMRWDLLPNDFCRRGVAGEIQLYEPDARRTFLHVEDAARAFQLALDGTLSPGVWNVGHEEMNWNKRMLAAAVHAITDCTIGEMPGHDPDMRDYAVSYEKVRGAGFHPLYGLRPSLPGIVQAAEVWR